MNRVVNPLRHFRCSICGAEAPKLLLAHNKFAERMTWLRRHYKRVHPEAFRKWYRRNPAKAQPKKWAKIPDIFNVSDECRRKMWKKGMVV